MRTQGSGLAKRLLGGAFALLAVTLVTLVTLGLGWPACSGGDLSRCGNGKVEKGEACDCGTDPNNLPPGCHTVNDGVNSSCSGQCTIRAVVVTDLKVYWTINGRSFLGDGSFDTCNDVKASFIRIRLVGQNGFSREHAQQSCGDYVAIFTDDLLGERLLPGEYTVYLEIQDSQGNALAPSVEETFLLAEGPGNSISVNFPLESFYDYENMTGSLLYRLHWNERDVRCADASPSISSQTVVLSQNGEPLPGYPLVGPCSDSTTTVQNLTPGDYHLRVEARDATDFMQYCHEEPVKVGAGVQPSYQIIVSTLDASACE